MKKQIVSLLVLAGSANAASTDFVNAQNLLNSAPAEIKEVMESAPATYNFNSKLGLDKSSVVYTGQTFRQVLINDIKIYMAAGKRGSFDGILEDSVDVLNSYYRFQSIDDTGLDDAIDSYTEFSVSAMDINGAPAQILGAKADGKLYGILKGAGKNLAGKMAGNDNSLRRGELYGVKGFVTPEDYMNSLFDEYAYNATMSDNFVVPNGLLRPQVINKATVTEDGRDLSQLVQKFAHGAISYSQSARDYFSVDLGAKKGLNADNTKEAKPGKSYTAMEHHFDEGYGYFGAARDLLAYDFKNIPHANYYKVSLDTNADGFIDLETEKNQGVAVTAMKMDRAYGHNFVNNIMKSLLAGRTLIEKAPAGYKDYVVANARVALGNWEKVFAGVTVHYINRTVKMINSYGTESYLFKDYAKFWSEMKGYGLAFQFSPNSIMTDARFDEIHALMKDAPVLPHAVPSTVEAYKADLLEAKRLIEETYNF